MFTVTIPNVKEDLQKIIAVVDDNPNSMIVSITKKRIYIVGTGPIRFRKTLFKSQYELASMLLKNEYDFTTDKSSVFYTYSASADTGKIEDYMVTALAYEKAEEQLPIAAEAIQPEAEPVRQSIRFKVDRPAAKEAAKVETPIQPVLKPKVKRIRKPKVVETASVSNKQTVTKQQPDKQNKKVSVK